jgi:hypothetical protein
MTRDELEVAADLTARLCRVEIDGQVAHDRDCAPELFARLLLAINNARAMTYDWPLDECGNPVPPPMPENARNEAK